MKCSMKRVRESYSLPKYCRLYYYSSIANIFLIMMSHVLSSICDSCIDSLSIMSPDSLFYLWPLLYLSIMSST